MSAHPLTTFILETFGRQFADLLLAGYGAQPSTQHRKLYVTESVCGVETRWVIELVSRCPPCRDEPLVLAALLKLLLSRPNISQHLEFEVGELLAELQWGDDAGTRRQAETAIVGYARLLYAKEMDEREGRGKSVSAGGGYYHLMTGYIKEAKSSRRGGALIRNLSAVSFDIDFIKGLRLERVYFAGMDFSALHKTKWLH
jgi:hypothetical protein